MSRLSSWRLGEAAALPSQVIIRDPDLYYAGVGVGAPRHRGAGRRLLLQRGPGAHSIIPPSPAGYSSEGAVARQVSEYSLPKYGDSCGTTNVVTVQTMWT